MAVVPMPETTVDEDRSAIPWKDQIRPSGELRGMNTEPEATSMERFAQDEFRLGILAPYS